MIYNLMVIASGVNIGIALRDKNMHSTLGWIVALILSISLIAQGG